MPSTQEIIIRAATTGDFAALGELALRLGAFPLPPWRTAEEIARADGSAMRAAVTAADPDNEVFIAERDGSPVGCLHMLAPTDFFGRRHAHVSVLAAARNAEGTGVGRALIAHAERWAARRGLALVTLNVFAGNARARRIYEEAGFTEELVKYAKAIS